MKRIIFAAVAVCTTFSFAHAKELQRVEEKQARSLFVQHFKSGGRAPDDYTYQQIGGIVRRYRFTFDSGTKFRGAECAVVGQSTGAAPYYE